MPELRTQTEILSTNVVFAGPLLDQLSAFPLRNELDKEARLHVEGSDPLALNLADEDDDEDKSDDDDDDDGDDETVAEADEHEDEVVEETGELDDTDEENTGEDVAAAEAADDDANEGEAVRA